MRQRAPVRRPPESREFVDSVMAGLRADGYSPAAWLRFLARSGRRSVDQMLLRPRAAVEVLAVYSALIALGAPRLRATVAGFLALTHLGLLGDRRSLGLANLLSLIRSGLPAQRWTVPVALATDVLDGVIGRREGTTAYGNFADPLADVAFWSAIAYRSDTGNLARLAIVGLWAAPAAAIMVAYFAAGRPIDYPRPLVLRRISAITQAVLALRIMTRGARPSHRPVTRTC